LLVAGVIVVGVMLSLVAYHKTSTEAERLLLAEFARRADVRTARTNEVVANFENSLFGLSQLLIGSQEVTRAEFALAAQAMRGRYPGISALEWVQIVPDAQRAEMEARVSRELGRKFEFISYQDGRGAIRSPATPDHYPILYVEPLAGNEPALGFDLAFGPTTADLAWARSSGQMAVSQRIRVIQDPSLGSSSVILIWPVNRPTDSEPEFLGFVQGVFRLSDMLVGSLREQGGDAFDILWLDPRVESGPARFLHYYSPDQVGEASPPSEQEFRAGHYRKFKLNVGGRHWLALYRPNAGWASTQLNNRPLLRLFAVLAMTGLLARLIHVVSRRTETIENLVVERTAELEESRGLLLGIMQALPGVAFRYLSSSGGQMTYASNGIESLTGHCLEEFTSGRSIYRDIIHPDDIARVRRLTEEALGARKLFDIEYRIRTKDGAEKWVLSRGHGRFSSQGELLYLEGLAIDISQRKKAEAAKLLLERRLLDDQKLKSLGSLAGGIAHDFNNLLTSILGNGGLAQMDLPTGSPAIHSLKQIETASQRAALLCQHMLEFAGRGRGTTESINLSELITSMEPLFLTTIPSKVTLELWPDGHLPACSGDTSQLRQVLINLVVNAAEAIGDKEGRITLSTDVEDLDQAEINRCATGQNIPVGRYLTLTIADNGDGMQPEVITRIFEPFFSTKFAGRGLGLAAVLGIVRGHHGAVRVTSQPEVGSTIKLILPLATPAKLAPPAAGESPPPEMILVIDDDQSVCEVTAELLRSLDYEAVTAPDGESGLALFQEEPNRYDYDMLDFVMPGMSGADTLDRLRALRPNVRVLMMSGNDQRNRVIQMAARGPLAYITKPFNREALTKVLANLKGQ